MANFIKHTACDKCGSSDGLAHYDDGSKHCFVCRFTVHSEEYKESAKSSSKSANKSAVKHNKVKENTMGTEFEDKPKSTKPVITEEEGMLVKNSTGTDPRGYRGIRADISKQFGVRYEYSTECGSVVKTYYPCTKNYELSGYKVRKYPKDFSTPYGITGKDCELFGQFKFKTMNNIVLIVGGEHDCLAAYQMLADYQKNKQFDPVAVVSPTIGETASSKQIQNQYNFFNQFKKCIIAMDSDAAGEEAVDKIAKVLS